MPEILCACEHDFTSFVRMEYDDNGLLMTYGNRKPIEGFTPIHFEFLPFEEFPELRGVYSGGWCWDELWALVMSFESADIDQTPMTLEQDSSGAWHETIIFHSLALAD